MQLDDDGITPAGFVASRLAKWMFDAEGHALCRRFQYANRFWQLPIAVSWQAHSGLYVVEDAALPTSAPKSPSRIVIARPERIFRYRRGVAERVSKLAGKYFIDRVPLDPDDVVVDCGANVGEVGMYVRSREAVRIIAVEPSDREALACDANLFGGECMTHRLALWHSEGEQSFFDSNTTGDSSLIAPAAPYADTSAVRTTTLDRLVDENGLGKIKLLKVEGEGAEPEILAGSRRTIDRVVYCTVDCGPERGPTQKHVIPEVCNFLMGVGFELLDVNLERQIFWFRKRNMV